MANKNIKTISKKIRHLILDMAYRSQAGEVGSALCISDILAVLYFRILSVDPRRPDKDSRDRFILSKGHGAAALYATLALRGFFPIKDLWGYKTTPGRFHLHPCRDAAPGIEVSTGSLGHGLSIGAGIALYLRETNPHKKVYVLLGDGECNEGSIWEAALFIATHKLSNVIVIIDENKFQGFGETGCVHPMNFNKKWSAFGWKVLKADGHNLKDIEEKLLKARSGSSPTVVVARTVAGKGVPYFENTLSAHYALVDKQAYQEALRIL